MGRLDGKIVLITGAGQGIGKASAILFAKEGAQVIATDLDPLKLEDLKPLSGISRIQKLDVTNPTEIKDLASSITKIDVIFNCAGIVPAGTILDCDEATWQLTLDLNVKSAFRICKALIPIVLGQGSGCSIVNMASMASSVKGVPNRFAYSVSKAALIGLSKAIAADFVQHGIRANSICPATVDTPSLRGRIASADDPIDAQKQFLARQKMGRFANAEEIAALALYLASDESSYVTGTEFLIDGGWNLA